MRKILISISLSLISGLVFAEDSSTAGVESSEYQAFQKFDNQFYIGLGTNYGNLVNAYQQNTNYGTDYMAFGIERLFDMGLWLQFNGSLMTNYTNYNSSNPNAADGPLGQDPSIGNLNLKVGYAFNVVPDTLLVTPYAIAGRNTNLTSNSLNNNMSTGGGVNVLTANVTQDYFLSGGLGGRVEYRLDKMFEFYFDQNMIYNLDRSQPNSNYTPASNYQFVSTLGAKYNVWEDLQLGLQAYYQYNQLSGAASYDQQYQLYQKNQVGVLATIGLTY